jgi:transposase
MLTFGALPRIYLHARSTDLRKSFDGLSGLVRAVFQADPLDGSLFLFLNRRRDRIKLLWWDDDGFILVYKRLERGTFEMMTAADDAAVIEIDATQLAMLLRGVSIASAKRRKRFARPGQHAA